MKKKKLALIITAVFVLGCLFGCVAGTSTNGNATGSSASNDDSATSDQYDTLNQKYTTLQKEYSTYKEKMEPYENLEAKEAKAREIEADEKAEEQKQKKEKEATAAKKEAAEKEKKGYNTGITYNQLARTPDDYTGEKVKFSGTVIQVLEDSGETTIRLAVKDDYDTVLIGSYDSSIVTSRVLEDDEITIMGTSAGLYSYESTMGGTITIPAVLIDQIES